MDGMSEAPTRFKYKELVLATENFTNEPGKGGFGAVYKGVLANGQVIAVKRLEKSGQGEKQFRAGVCRQILPCEFRHISCSILRRLPPDPCLPICAHRWLSSIKTLP